MSTDENEVLHRRFFEGYSEQRLEAVEELLADGFVAHFGGQRLDRAAYFGFVRAFYAAFPDLRNTVE